MIRTDLGALLLAVLLSACSSAGPTASSPPPPAASPGPDAPPDTSQEVARRVAQVTLDSLGKRKFDLNGCDASLVRIVKPSEAERGVKAGDKCTVLVSRRPDRTWIVLVRAAQHGGEVEAGNAQAGSVQAVATVTPGGEGVSHIDYKP